MLRLSKPPRVKHICIAFRFMINDFRRQLSTSGTFCPVQEDFPQTFVPRRTSFSPKQILTLTLLTALRHSCSLNGCTSFLWFDLAPYHLVRYF